MHTTNMALNLARLAEDASSPSTLCSYARLQRVHNMLGSQSRDNSQILYLVLKICIVFTKNCRYYDNLNIGHARLVRVGAIVAEILYAIALET